MDNNEIFEPIESIEETLKLPNPPIWYAMIDDKERIVDIRSSNQIYPVNPDTWHELQDFDENISLYDNNNVLLYKLIDNQIVERTLEEREADIPKPQEPIGLLALVQQLQKENTDLQLAICELYEQSLGGVE